MLRACCQGPRRCGPGSIVGSRGGDAAARTALAALDVNKFAHCRSFSFGGDVVSLWGASGKRRRSRDGICDRLFSGLSDLRVVVFLTTLEMVGGKIQID